MLQPELVCGWGGLAGAILGSGTGAISSWLAADWEREGEREL